MMGGCRNRANAWSTVRFARPGAPWPRRRPGVHWTTAGPTAGLRRRTDSGRPAADHGDGEPLRRDPEDRLGGGVAAGIAAWRGFSPTTVRIALVVAALISDRLGGAALRRSAGC